MSTAELKAQAVSREGREQLNTFQESLTDPELRKFLISLIHMIEQEDEVTLYSNEPELTPNEAAEKLHVSRTFLIKVMDRGDLPFHRVGRDRRIKFSDLMEFEKKRRAHTKAAVESHEHHEQNRAEALDILTNLLP